MCIVNCCDQSTLQSCLQPKVSSKALFAICNSSLFIISEVYAFIGRYSIVGRQNKADSRWLQQVKQSGTTADKLAALTLLIQACSASARLATDDHSLNYGHSIFSLMRQ